MDSAELNPRDTRIRLIRTLTARDHVYRLTDQRLCLRKLPTLREIFREISQRKSALRQIAVTCLENRRRT